MSRLKSARRESSLTTVGVKGLERDRTPSFVKESACFKLHREHVGDSGVRDLHETIADQPRANTIGVAALTDRGKRGPIGDRRICRPEPAGWRIDNARLIIG
jgi:hypothetical protein